MQIKEFDIILDIKKHRKIEEFEVVQGDIDTNQLNIILHNGLDIYSLENLDVEIAFAKSDGTTVLQSSQDEENPIIIEGDKIICTLKTNTIAAPGKVLAEIRILEDTRLLTSARFEFYVRKAIVNDDTIKSTNEFPLLNKLINDTKNIVEAVPAIESKLEEINDTESELNQSILEGNTLKGDLDSSIQEGNLLKVGLDNSITEGNAVKGELDDIIKNTDFEQVLIELNNKADKAEFDNLAGEGRTTETVKGNADDLVAHKAETNAHGNDGNILYFEDKTQVRKSLEEVFTARRIESETDFYNYIDNVANDMPNQTYYKRYLTFAVSIPSLPSGGANILLEGCRASAAYQWQKITTYSGDGSMVYRNCFNGVWSRWHIIATDKPTPWLSPTFQNGWQGRFQFRKNSQGQLELRMYLTAGTITSGTTITTPLLEGFRPIETQNIYLYNPITGHPLSRPIVIGTSGNVSVFGNFTETAEQIRGCSASIVLPL